MRDDLGDLDRLASGNRGFGARGNVRASGSWRRRWRASTIRTASDSIASRSAAISASIECWPRIR